MTRQQSDYEHYYYVDYFCFLVLNAYSEMTILRPETRKVQTYKHKYDLYKYLSCLGIESATASTTVSHMTTVSTYPRDRNSFSVC